MGSIAGEVKGARLDSSELGTLPLGGSERLVILTRANTAIEASILQGRLNMEGIPSRRGGEVFSSWCWHMGATIAGVTVLVKESDSKRAAEILAAIVETRRAREEAPLVEELVQDSSSDLNDVMLDGDALPRELIYAWRASVIGFVFLQPILHIYSMWILLKNGLFYGRVQNWRVPAAIGANMIFLLACLILLAYALR